VRSNCAIGTMRAQLNYVPIQCGSRFHAWITAPVQTTPMAKQVVRAYAFLKAAMANLAVALSASQVPFVKTISVCASLNDYGVFLVNGAAASFHCAKIARVIALAILSLTTSSSNSLPSIG
jgi:hypothetical protein